MLSNAFVRGLRGPIGSAKSSTCTMEVFRRCTQQEPDPETGKRRTRWAIIRSTNPQLRTTTIKTWQDWFPPHHFGEIAMHPPPFTQNLRFGDVDAEIIFLALDSPEDIRKLLSLELTGAWINEARETPKTIVDAVTSRLRRFPALKDGGATWSGLIMDTNSPDDDHWWPIMSGEVPPPDGMSAEERLMLVKPHNWEFFEQPAAMKEVRHNGTITGYERNPDAENVQNLHKDYYPELITGKTRNWINVYVMNKIGADFDGRKVHPHFFRDVHVMDEVEPSPGRPIIGGVDFGLTPACIFMQEVQGQWRIFDEIVLENAGAKDLAIEVNRVLANRYPDFTFIIHGDPAGDQRVGTDKATPFSFLRAANLVARPTATNDPEVRRAAMSGPLQRLVDGKPGMVIDRVRCPILIKGLDGGWHYRRIRSAQGEVYSSEPDKNKYSHPCEAAEYGLLGGGEGRRALGKNAGALKAVNARVRVDPLDRLRRRRG
jgi:hypothetical protein